MNLDSVRATHRILVFLCLIGNLTLARPTHAMITFTLNDTSDAVDASPGDSMCATVSGVCTLRAAIQEANALAGLDTILVPAGTYRLTIAGASEDAAATGDLDITDDLILKGRGADPTVVDGNGDVIGDRVFHVLSPAIVTLSDLTISGGKAEDGGGIYNSGTLTMADGGVSENTATGTLFAGGGGLYNDGKLTIYASTIWGNSSADRGGGIFNNYGMFEIKASMVASDTASHGGGIYNEYGAVLISDSTFSGSTASIEGSGIYSTGTATIVNTTFSSNIGTGIYNGGLMKVNQITAAGNTGRGIANYGKMTISYGTIRDNIGGGGIFNSGTLDLIHSTVSGNTAADGGGILNYWSPSTLNVENSTISGNTAYGIGGSGGGVSIREGTVKITNSTIYNNAADLVGGGIFLDAAAIDLGTVTLANTILAGNTANLGPDCWLGVTSYGYSIVEHVTDCAFQFSVGDQLGVDPLLGPLQANGGPTVTHALLDGSPANDAGNPAGCT